MLFQDSQSLAKFLLFKVLIQEKELLHLMESLIHEKKIKMFYF